MLWASGPLEVRKQQESPGFSAEARETLERWHQPSALEFLKRSPVNCLVVSWAAGLPEDPAQQKSLAPLVEAGRAAGLTIAGLITGRTDKRAAIQAARASGIQALVIEGEIPDCDLPVIPMAEAGSAPWASSPPAVALVGCRWPSIQGSPDPRESNDVNAAGTHMAWIDSNIHLLELARAYAPQIPIWLTFSPPRDETVTVQAYLRAVADSGMAGAQWVVSLDGKLRSGLAARSPDALNTWQEVSGALAFFSRHRAWVLYRPKAVLGVLSDFAGGNRTLGEEILNLLARRNVMFRVIPKSAADRVTLTGLRAVISMDEEPPDAAVRQRLLEFARQGGLLITRQGWAKDGSPIPGIQPARFEINAVGNGRLAVSRETSPDPFLVARDAHILLDRTNDLLRFYNTSTTIGRLTAGGGQVDLLEFVVFARRDPRDPITVWLRDPHKTARLWSLGDETPAAVNAVLELGGTAVHLPSVPIYGAVELG
jgi:hypothetical protein